MSEKVEIIIQAKDQFSRTMKSLRGMLPSVKTLALGAGAAVAGLGTGLFAIANSTAKAGDEFQKMSLRLGLSTDMLSGMKHAVELSGSSMESLEKGVRTLAKRMSDADEGLTEAERSFTALGIQIKNADGSLKDLDTMMAEAAQGLAGMEDNTKRVALAQELFGRSGTALLPLFKQGAEGLRKMTEEAKALGITFDKAGADQAAEFKDNMLRLQRVFTGIKTQIGKELIPIFNEWADVGAEAGKRVIKYIKYNKKDIQSYAKTFLTAVGEIAEKGAYGVALLIDSFRGLKMIWQGLKIAFAEFSLTIINSVTKLIEWFDKQMSDLGLTFEKALENAPADQMTEAFLNVGETVANLNKQLENTKKNTQDSGKTVVKFLEDLGKSSEKTLEKLAKAPMAITQVTNMADKIKAAIKAIQEAAKNAGIPPFDDDNTEKTKKNVEKITTAQQGAIDSLHEMWNEYFLTEAEQIDVWYLEQQEKYAGHRDALNELDEIYLAKHIELGLKQGQKRIDAEKAANDRIKAERTQALQNLTNIGLLFGKKGLAISRALAIPHAVIATRDAAISAYKAMAGIPIIGPALGVAAAGAAIAYGMKQVGLIKAQKAHTGLTRVPREQAYVLAERERVLSPSQNEDFTRFLARQQETINVENFIINLDFLPNATNLDAIRSITKHDMEDLVEDKFIPALRKLKLLGITI